MAKPAAMAKKPEKKAKRSQSLAGLDETLAGKSKKTASACTCCGARPYTTAWANVSRKRGGDEEVPVGDRCMSCQNVFTSGFGYTDWESYVKIMGTEEP